jgi:hypothetical protein
MRLVSFGLAVVVGLFALGSIGLADSGPVLHVTVPPGIDANRMLVLFGQYGQGLTLGQARVEKGAADFTVGIGEAANTIKLLIYYPGCKIVTAEIARVDLTKPFTPVFEKLSTTRLTLTLTLFDGTPIVDRKVSVRQSIPDMEYFGYSDGMDLSQNACAVASGTTDKSGRLTVRVPVLLNDPLFADPKLSPGFSIRLDNDQLAALDYNLDPNFISAQRRFSVPVAIKLIYRSSISGKVDESFLRRNGVAVPMGQSVQPDGYTDYSVWFEADHKGGGSGVGVQADGSFAMSLSPGTYDLSIQVRRGPGTEWKTLTVQKGFEIGEKEKKEITVK